MEQTLAGQVRPALAADSEMIAAIYAHHVQHGTATFETIAPSPADMADKIATCRARDWPFLVMEQGGSVIGYAYATQFRDRPAYRLTCENSIYIDQRHVGRGVGKTLLAALLPAAEMAGFRQMIAVVGGGEPASVALHRGMGFTETGRMQSVGRKFGRWLDTVYLQIALGEGDSSPPDVEPT